jgi:hypothetical protein
MMIPPTFCRCLGLAAMSFVSFAGCGESIQFAPVRGQVLVRGEPARAVRVEFHPDSVDGTRGPSSSGETDAEGRFALAYATPSATGQGAAVGRHRVVLRDLALAASETGLGVAVRFGPDYANLLTTPLRADVKALEKAADEAVGNDLVIEVPANTVRTP